VAKVWLSDAWAAERRFVYEEGANPERFFVPLTWASVVEATPDLIWSAGSLRLFPPEEAGLQNE
jgi:hypothetical protein